METYHGCYSALCTVQIFGLDFSSAPSRRNPIALAHCRLDGGVLTVDGIWRLTSLERFARSLDHAGVWVAGMDFPFGLPRRLARERGWPEDWEAMVDLLEGMGRPAFEDLLEMYKAARPAGAKEPLRAGDRAAGALSPVKLYRPPVAKMFFEGATRLRRTQLNVLPCRPTGDPRTVVESYPGLAARRLVGRRSYKAFGKATQAQHDARRDLIAAVRSPRLADLYGLRIELSAYLAEEMVEDPRADLLDAVLCAVQAAWAFGERDRSFGIPRDADPLEGWIADAGVV